MYLIKGMMLFWVTIIIYLKDRFLLIANEVLKRSEKNWVMIFAIVFLGRIIYLELRHLSKPIHIEIETNKGFQRLEKKYNRLKQAFDLMKETSTDNKGFQRLEKKYNRLKQAFDLMKEKRNFFRSKYGEKSEEAEIIDTIRDILTCSEYTDPNDLGYSDKYDWTITDLKSRARDLGLRHLSHYTLKSRKALAQSIRSREQVHLIARELGIEDRTVQEVESEEEQST